MRRITLIMATVLAMALGATPASALPVLDQENKSVVVQGNDTATGGSSQATGGNGGNASTGNKQVLNGNSIALIGDR